MKKRLLLFIGLLYCLFLPAQINTDRVILIGRNALYYEDYILSIQYFNQVIKAKPYLSEPYFYRAIAKYFLDDMKGAEDDCTLALTKNPFMTKAYQLRADTRQAMNDYEGAIEDYAKALKVYPNDKFLLINLAVAKIQDKDLDESEKVLDRLVRFHPKYSPAYLTRSALYQEKKDTIRAFDEIEKAIEVDKYMPQAYSMRGILNYQTKEYEKSLSDFDEAIKLEPKQLGNYINRGLVRYSLNDVRGAMQDYDKVIGVETNNSIARFNRGLLRSQVGDYNRAIEDFDIVLSQEPTNYIAYINRGLTKHKIGNYKEALKDIDIVLKRYPEFYQGFYTRAEIKRKQNDLKGAQDDYNHAKEEEKRIRKEVAKGKTEMQTREESDNDIGKFDLLVVADKASEEKTKYDSNRFRGKVQDRQIELELKPRYIVSYYEKETDITNPVHFSILLNDINKKQILPRTLRITNTSVALNELQVREHFYSIDELSDQIARSPNDALLYYARAMDYMLVQDFTSSISDLKKAVEIDPNFTLAYFHTAVVYTKQLALKEDDGSKYENINTENDDLFSQKSKIEAIAPKTGLIDPNRMEYDMINKSYSKVIELDPTFVYAYYNKAEIDYYNKDYRSAVLNYNEAIRQNPEFAEAYYNRALCRFHLKDEKRALQDMRKAGELGIMEAYSIIKRMTEY